MTRPALAAFTLIELLVVVTIITVLLALLTPAMDGAMYQAQLAVCGANHHAIAAGASTYAVQNARSYPHRKALTGGGQPNQLNNPWTGGWDPASTDDRYVIKDYIGLDTFLDPLCDKIEIDPSETRPSNRPATASGADPFVYSGVYLFYGLRYLDNPGQRGMMKLGDRFTWATGEKTADNAFSKTGAWSFDVLSADQNGLTLTLGGFVSSHPDDKNLLPIQTFRNEQVAGSTAGLGLDGGFYLTLSRWIIANSSERRGLIDVNFARVDGGVSRLNDLTWDDEERVTSAPIDINGPGDYDYYLNIPR